MGLGLLANEGLGFVLLALGILIFVVALARKKSAAGAITNDTVIAAAALSSTVLATVGIGFIVSGFA